MENVDFDKIIEISKIHLSELEKDKIYSELNKFIDELKVFSDIKEKENNSFLYSDNINVYSNADFNNDRESILNNSKLRNGNYIEFMEKQNE